MVEKLSEIKSGNGKKKLKKKKYSGNGVHSDLYILLSIIKAHQGYGWQMEQ